jgi:hypothetical protein
MAISGSGLFVATIIDVFDPTALSIDLTSDEDLKAALFTNSITTPNLTTAVGYGATPFNANEVSGTGYTAGGATLTGTTFAGNSGVATFDANDVTWSSSTLTGVRGVLIYDDSQDSDNGIVLVDLGQDYATSNGNFVVQWDSDGIFALTLVPA